MAGGSRGLISTSNSIYTITDFYTENTSMVQGSGFIVKMDSDAILTKGYRDLRNELIVKL